MFGNPLLRLRVVGLLEGVSFLVLLGIAMPLKYLAGLPAAVSIVGWVHGALFILFVLALADAMVALRWTWKRGLVALIAAVVPFGPFVLDARLLREEQAAGAWGGS